MAKIRKLVVVPAPPPEDEDPPDCPRCPPKGAPAWMATFADMATLLMAFFVLILSFAEFDQPRFKALAGALREQFGVQSVVPAFDLPMGTTLLSPNFSPSPDPSVVEEMRQQTTDYTQPELDVRSDEETTEAEENARALAEAMAEALEGTGVEARAEGDAVVLTFPEGDSAEETQSRLAAAAEAMATAEAAQSPGAAQPRVLIEGLASAMDQLAQGPGGQAGEGGQDGESRRAAEQAAARLDVALREEIDQGLVALETREDRVFITVGAGGSFASGSADLTEAAREIMARIAFSGLGSESRIAVTGHTDDVPLNAASPYGDNWGLAAARAASVVREIGASGAISPANLSASSAGETRPVADNATAEGRALNRRIEIEITY